MHIAVAGNIGAGKTTLTRLLARHYGWVPKYEEVDNNPYLDDFYEDMKRWSFNLQVFFLKSRLQDILEIHESGNDVIQDRTIFEDAYIFAPNLHEMGLMTPRDFQNYTELFEMMIKLIAPPDLLIYLRASVPKLVGQIQKRGRDFEKSIRLDYLKALNDRYESFVANYTHGKVLVIDVDNINFAEKAQDLNLVINKIDAQLHGLF